jgi:hypothetical protein
VRGTVDAEGRERSLRLGEVDRVAEAEQAHQAGPRRVIGGGDPLGGQEVVPEQGRTGHRTEQFTNPGDGEVGGDEVSTQGGDEGAIGAGRGGRHRRRA